MIIIYQALLYDPRDCEYEAQTIGYYSTKELALIAMVKEVEIYKNYKAYYEEIELDKEL